MMLDHPGGAVAEGLTDFAVRQDFLVHLGVRQAVLADWGRHEAEIQRWSRQRPGAFEADSNLASASAVQSLDAVDLTDAVLRSVGVT